MDTGERAYEKIINYVEQQVMQGRYKKGDKLPPGTLFLTISKRHWLR